MRSPWTASRLGQPRKWSNVSRIVFSRVLASGPRTAAVTCCRSPATSLSPGVERHHRILRRDIRPLRDVGCLGRNRHAVASAFTWVIIVRPHGQLHIQRPRAPSVSLAVLRALHESAQLAVFRIGAGRALAASVPAVLHPATGARSARHGREIVPSVENLIRRVSWALRCRAHASRSARS